jgi:hypothetical protein
MTRKSFLSVLAIAVFMAFAVASSEDGGSSSGSKEGSSKSAPKDEVDILLDDFEKYISQLEDMYEKMAKKGTIDGYAAYGEKMHETADKMNRTTEKLNEKELSNAQRKRYSKLLGELEKLTR